MNSLFPFINQTSIPRVPADWFETSVPHWSNNSWMFQGLPLLCLHNLKESLERRIVAKIGGDWSAWEDDQGEIGELDESSPLCRVNPHWLDNWTCIAEAVRAAEAKEIEQLTGRAA